jgi:hypothetical protein
MIGAMARHRVQVLRTAGMTLKQIVTETGVSQRSVQRIECEPRSGDPLQARARVGRRASWAVWERLPPCSWLEPKTVEILHRLREQLLAQDGAVRGGARPGPTATPLVRFEGVAGEFSQHDFGQVDVRYLGGG